jgi:hypothetical protein
MDNDPLPPCDPDGNCPACLAPMTGCGFDYTGGNVDRWCLTCKYQWAEKPLFGEHGQFLFRRYQADSDCVACGRPEVTVRHMKDEYDVELYLHRSELEYFDLDKTYLVSFFVRRCKHCMFVWPETPLNR